MLLDLIRSRAAIQTDAARTAVWKAPSASGLSANAPSYLSIRRLRSAAPAAIVVDGLASSSASRATSIACSSIAGRVS